MYPFHDVFLGRARGDPTILNSLVLKVAVTTKRCEPPASMQFNAPEELIWMGHPINGAYVWV